MTHGRRQGRSAWRGAAAGAAGGLIGAWVMVRVNGLLGPRTGRSDRAGDEYPQRRDEARPNEIDGTIPDEPGSMQAASAIAEPLVHRRLTEREKAAGGSAVHYLFGITAGALYGAAAEYDTSVTSAGGSAFGFTVWAVANELGMQAAGFATTPGGYPLSRHAASLTTHVAFGMTVECVRRLVRGRIADAQAG